MIKGNLNSFKPLKNLDNGQLRGGFSVLPEPSMQAIKGGDSDPPNGGGTNFMCANEVDCTPTDNDICTNNGLCVTKR